MMKLLVCLSVMLVVCGAAPQYEDQSQPQQAPDVHILKQESDIRPDGYTFEFETSDGTSRQESASLKQLSDDVAALEVSGSYSYTAPDGVVYSVTYVADENGFRPQEHTQHN